MSSLVVFLLECGGLVCGGWLVGEGIIAQSIPWAWQKS